LAVSRAPLAKLQASSGGWVELPVARRFRQRLQRRLQLGFTEEQQRTGSIDYNYKPEKEMDVRALSGQPGGTGLLPSWPPRRTDPATYTRERRV